MRNRLLLSTAMVAALLTQAMSAKTRHKSPYAGQENRQIKSLSEDDIAELRRGGGWGMAKAAELNGSPGPAHLLEMAEEIGLSPEQVTAIEAVRVEMQREAVEIGSRLIRLEEELDDQFRNNTITPENLRSLVSQIAETRGRLRYTHLAAHLSTKPILTVHQIASYNRMRGYGADPCQSIPAGHDAEMWRKHNNCE